MSNTNRILDKPKKKLSSALRPKSKFTYAMPDDPLLKAIFIDSVERLGGKVHLEQTYDYLLNKYDEVCPDFWLDGLKKMNMKVDYDESQLAKVPQDQPVVFLANHPYGVVDGTISAYLANKSRGFFRVMINSALCDDNILAPYFLPINFEPSKEAIQETIQSKKDAIQTLKEKGTVVVFPAGGVSVAPKGFGMAHDLEWKLFTAKLIQMSRATVVPLYFVGQNSRIFQFLSHVNSTLRKSMFLREVNRLRGKTIRVNIGDPIPFSEIEHIKGRQELLDHLRQHTYSLGDVDYSPTVTLHWYK